MCKSCAELALPITWASWESWLWEHESKRANPTLSQLQLWKFHMIWPLSMEAWVTWSYHLSPVWWCGQRRDNFLSSSSPPVEDRRPSPEVIRAGELALPLTCCRIWRSRPFTSPGQYIGLSLMTEACVSQSLESGYGRAGPDPCLQYGDMRMERCPLSLNPCR